MIGDLLAAILLAIALSFLIAVIEIKNKSEADFKNCLGLWFIFYFAILAFANSVTTSISFTYLAEYFPNEAIGVADGTVISSNPSERLTQPTIPGERKTLTLLAEPWVWCAIVGVFGFEVILKHLNVTIFDTGVLTINDWIQKARNNAVADSIKSQTKKNVSEVVRVANILKDKVSPVELNTHAESSIGGDALARVKKNTLRNGGDEALALALAIANHNIDTANAIIGAKQHSD